jgi:hypothetical protein
MTERAGLGGRVHDGFYGALFHGDEEAGVLFSDLVAAIKDAGQQKTLYVTGADYSCCCRATHAWGGAQPKGYAHSMVALCYPFKGPCSEGPGCILPLAPPLSQSCWHARGVTGTERRQECHGFRCAGFRVAHYL